MCEEKGESDSPPDLADLEKTLASIVAGSAVQAQKKLKERETLSSVIAGLKAEREREVKKAEKKKEPH